MDLTQIGNLTSSCQLSSTSNVRCQPTLPQTDNIEHSHCKNVFLNLPFNKKIIKYCVANNINVHKSFLDFCKQNAHNLKNIQKIAKIKWIIVKKYSDSSKTNLYSIIYDGRFFNFIQERWKFQIWILNPKGIFLQKFTKLKRSFKLKPPKLT